MTTTFAPAWQSKRTDETCQVEEVLREAGFEKVDAYRYNTASIRVRWSILNSRDSRPISGTRRSNATLRSYRSARKWILLTSSPLPRQNSSKPQGRLGSSL